jgi:hypothetical protein
VGPRAVLDTVVKKKFIERMKMLKIAESGAFG